jgi:NAD kinase
MITFGQESIGYLCCFESENYEAVLFHSLIKIADDFDPSVFERRINEEEDEKYGDPYVETRERVVLKVGFENQDRSVKSSFNPDKKKVKFGTLYALNEITIDRGGFNYLTNIE